MIFRSYPKYPKFTAFPFHNDVEKPSLPVEIRRDVSLPADTPHQHKLRHLKAVAEQCDKKEERYFTDVVELFGEDTWHFNTINELNKFLDEEEKHNHHPRTKAQLALIKEMLSEYEKWKTTTVFDELVTLDAVKDGLSLKNTFPVGLTSQVTDLISVNAGLDYTKVIVKEIATAMLDQLGHDKEAAKRKKEYVILLLRLVFTVVSAGVAVEVVRTVLDEIVDHSANSILLSVMGAETLKEASYITADQFQRAAEHLIDVRIANQYVDNIIEILWKLSIKFIDKNIEFSKKWDNPMTDDELKKCIEQIRKKDLLPSLQEQRHPDQFEYISFVVDRIAKKILEERTQLLGSLNHSLSNEEGEAKTIITEVGSGHRQALQNFMVRHYNGGILCRAYFKKPTLHYQLADQKSELPGFVTMQKGSKGHLKHYPVDMDAEVRKVLEPKPPKGSMHIGGEHIREYVYHKLPDLHDPMYGYKKGGKWAHKKRIKDTWRADYIIQMSLIKNRDASDYPHSVLPFPTFKSSKQIGEAIIELLKINPYFQTGDYDYKEPHPTPLYLLSHMKDYQDLINRPGVKEYLKENIDPSLILFSVTDPNVTNSKDERRLTQALTDTFFFLKQIGYSNSLLDSIHHRCIGYIELQCHQRRDMACIESRKKKILAQAGKKHILHELKLNHSLDEHEIEINKLVAICDGLDPTDDRVELIKGIIASFLSSDLYDVSTQQRLHGLMPAIFKNELELTSDKKEFVQHLKNHELHRSRSCQLFNTVKEHNHARERVETLKTIHLGLNQKSRSAPSLSLLASQGKFAVKEEVNDKKPQDPDGVSCRLGSSSHSSS